MLTTLHQGRGWRARLATPEDNDALCALFRRVTMGGAIEVSQDRSPDFFAALRMHGGRHETFVAEADDGRLVGCGSYVLRDGLHEGRRLKVGYICDLRFDPAFRDAKVLPPMGRAALERARDVHGAEVFTTAVIDGNRRAVASTVNRTPHRAEQPVSRPMTPYWMASLPFTGRGPQLRREVIQATRDDLRELVGFLARKQAERTFGYVVDEAFLQDRFRTWPGFTLESFLLVRDRSGALVGCAAPWDADPVKRTRVHGYHGGMRLYRAAFNAYARLRPGVEPLPAPGEAFHFATLTHVEVEGDDPEVFSALLSAAHQRLRDRGLHFLGVMVPRGSPLEAGLRGFHVSRMALTLYAVSLVGSPWNSADVRTLAPGFEMALA